ncbi:MAG: signal recognition particle-docking protein FtsY [Oscillospiraceae bacterium]
MGFFSKLKEGLKKTKDNIGKKIFAAFSGRALDDDFYEELEEAMLTADMGVTATEQILDEFKDEVYREKITDTEKAKNLLKRIMVDSISYDIPDYDYPLVILLAGVNGVGKTTAIGKLANYFKSIGESVVVAAADTFRAAASDQLEVWADRANVRIIKHKEGSDPASVVFDAISSAKARGDDVILVDTAGRLHNKKNLMDELKKIHKVIIRELPNADYRSYIVLDATTGQNALSQVEIFSEAIDIDGIILTKLDGTAKGGVVMAISAEQEIPVVFVGVGEKIDDLLPFNPEEFVDAIFEN